MKDFATKNPQLAAWLREQKRQHPDGQDQGLTHWLLLIGFGGMTVASLPWHFAILALLLITTALWKGPGMLLFGILYAALVSFFPPLGLVLSAFFFFLSLWQLGRNWLFYLFSSGYFALPFVFKLLGLTDVTSWPGALTLAVSLVVLHLLLTRLYRLWDSRSLFWSLWAAPFDGLIFLLPKRFSKRLAPDLQEALSYGERYRLQRQAKGLKKPAKSKFH